MPAWKSIYNAHRDPLTVLMCEPSDLGPHRTRAPVANIPPSTFADPTASIVDETLAASVAGFTHRLCRTLAPSSGSPPTPTTTIFPPSSFVLGMASAGATGAATAIYHVLMHRNPPGRGDRADELLGGEFHRLACLGRRRYGLGTLSLPLDAVGVVAMALGKVEHPEMREVQEAKEEVKGMDREEKGKSEEKEDKGKEKEVKEEVKDEEKEESKKRKKEKSKSKDKE